MRETRVIGYVRVSKVGAERLVAAGLVDEFWLKVNAVATGRGGAVFDSGAPATELEGHCARSSLPTASSFLSRSRRRPESVSFSRKRWRCWKRRRSRRPRSHSSPRSIRWSGTGDSSDPSSNSSM